ncbi:MAG: ABC transporter permease, partial [Bacillota bacterium]
MNLITLAFRNIKLNRKKYIMYLFSMGFSVFTVYTFLALMQNETVMMAFEYDTRYRSLLTSFGVIILVFVLFFLISSNNSFIRARKKEISTYALFGMTNLKIGKLLFLETIIAGCGTLAVGIGAGIFFSKLMAMFLLDLTLSNFIGDVAFIIDSTAIYKTALLFIIIFCFMGFSGLRVIYKFELVDLFKAEKVAEGRYKGSILVLILSLLLIGTGYLMAFSQNLMIVVYGAIPILILVISGTYLFFWGGMPKVLSLIKRNKSIYYQGVNLVSTSSVSHRMKSIASIMATIAVLSAVATTAIATGFTLYSNAEKNTYRNTGFDLAYHSSDQTLKEQIHEAIEDNMGKIEGETTVDLYETYPKIKTIMVAGVEHLTPEDYFRVYPESTYNQLISKSKTNLEAVKIPSGESLYIYPYSPNEIEEVMIGQEFDFSRQSIRVTSLLRSGIGGFGLDHILILDDKDFENFIASNEIVPTQFEGKNETATVINYKDSLNSKPLNTAIETILNGKAAGYRTAYNLYNESMLSFGLICFIGFFMSGVFILMTASLLYFKQVMAAEEEHHQYRMLRRIGMTDSMERQVIKKRLLPVFFIP